MLNKVLTLGVFCSVALFSQAKADESVEGQEKSGNCGCPKKRVVLCAQFNDEEPKKDGEDTSTTTVSTTETTGLLAACPGKCKPPVTAQVEPEQTEVNTMDQNPENAIVQGKVA